MEAQAVSAAVMAAFVAAVVLLDMHGFGWQYVPYPDPEARPAFERPEREPPYRLWSRPFLCVLAREPCGEVALVVEAEGIRRQRDPSYQT